MNGADAAEVLAELSGREPVFHRAEHGAVQGATREDFARMVTEEFWEVGASGRGYTREFVLTELEKRFAEPHEDVWETRDFACRRLAEDLYLLTYTLVQDRVRVTRRATIWRRTGDGWKVEYHQGTLVQDASE
jgi:hypothetical protein